MFKNFIFHQRTWLIILITTYAIVGSCRGSCQKRGKAIKEDKPTSLPKPSTAPITPPTAPIDETDADNLDGATESLHSETSSSSGVSSGSSYSGNSSDGSYPGNSSGYASSSSSSSSGLDTPPSPTDFAGLPNSGNTCYMNAVLQIIAALYKDEAKNSPSLIKLINKINTTHNPLDGSNITELNSLPEKAREMATSRQQQDPDEFIYALEGRDFLESISYTENLLFKRENNEQFLFQKQLPAQSSYALRVSFSQKSTDGIDLSKMIASSREELVKDGGIEIDSWDQYLPYKGAMSSFLKENKSTLEPQQGSRLKHYIKQQIIDKMPSKLYVQLNRFSDPSKKITDLVHGTMEITIHPDPNKDHTVSFDLNGFIVHIGNGTQSGHYVAYVKRENENFEYKWYKADDKVIQKITLTEATAESKKAYLLFYKKR